MPQQSKFAGALARLKQPATELPPEEPAVQEEVVQEPVVQERSATPIPVATGGGKGRPATGKRSDPEWNRYTVLLRKVTHKRASRRLEDLDTGQDLSELLDELLTKWLDH
jgi:hypothetical protein